MFQRLSQDISTDFRSVGRSLFKVPTQFPTPHRHNTASPDYETYTVLREIWKFGNGERSFLEQGRKENIKEKQTTAKKEIDLSNMFSLTSTLISTLSILPTLLPAVLAHPQPLPLPITSSSPGCGKPHTLPGTTHYRLNLPSPAANNTTTRRSYSYHLPANYNPSTPYPVVLGFHGSSSTGVFFELDTKMSEARFSGDKIVVYPNGEGWSWAGASYHEGSSLEEDVGFVERAVRDLGERVCVDGGRVYAVG